MVLWHNDHLTRFMQCKVWPNICTLGVRGEDHHLCEEWAEEIQEDAESRLPRELWE